MGDSKNLKGLSAPCKYTGNDFGSGSWIIRALLVEKTRLRD